VRRVRHELALGSATALAILGVLEGRDGGDDLS